MNEIGVPPLLWMSSVSTAKGPTDAFNRCFAINGVLIKYIMVHPYFGKPCTDKMNEVDQERMPRYII